MVYNKDGTVRKRAAKPKVCNFCGATYYNYRRTSKYCSVECSIKVRARTRRTAECIRCGVKFSARAQGYNKYCSVQCSREHKKEIRKVLPIKVCIECGEEYTSINKMFCSQTCNGAFSKKKNAKICKHCGKNYNGGGKVYCSQECAVEGQKARITLICDQCGKTFERKASLRKNKFSFCSSECSQAHTVENFSKAGRKYKMKPRVRFAVLERDGFTCQYCGRSPKAHGIDLHIDHIIPRAVGGLDDLENLTTACDSCNIGKSDHLLRKEPVLMELMA